VTVDPLGSLPIVPDTALPADVRNGTAQDKQTYQAALGFERELVSQLMQSMTATAFGDDSSASSDDSTGDDSSSDGSDAVSNTYQQMLPDQLTDALINGGGTGLAEGLYHALRQGQGQA
jgi:Rod binding domain-containing protein